MIKVYLTRRIWLSFIALLFLVGLLLIIIYPLSLKSTLTEETYQIIEQEQKRYAQLGNNYQFPPETEVDFIERREAERSVGHLLLMNQFGRLQGDPVPSEVLSEMSDKARNQLIDRGRYELTYNGATLFYVVLRLETRIGDAFHIAYMWDTYRDQMVNRLWGRLIYILLLSTVLSLFPAFWLKYYLRQPLAVLGNHFEQISNRNWKEPIQLEGDEDFKKLSNQFERMRQNLIRHDRAQTTFIQHASHELKTPIMVIKSYAKSIQDGILPKENLEKTMDVIIEEANRMETRVKDMLYYTKLDTLKTEVIKKELFAFGSIAFDLEERYRVQRKDIIFDIDGADVIICGDQEQIKILLENLVENALRYATSKISLCAMSNQDTVELVVKNDGQPIPDKEMNYIFTPFHKGNKGQFGLGLAIVKRIAELHGGFPSVKNENDGVRFTVEIQRG